MVRAERSAKYGKIWKTSILGNPTVMIFEEEACRKVLKEEGRLVEVIWPDVTAELVGCYIREASSDAPAVLRLSTPCSYTTSSMIIDLSNSVASCRVWKANIVSVCSFASMTVPPDELPRSGVEYCSLQVGPQSLNLLEGPVHIHLKRLLGDAFSEEAVNAFLPQLQICAQSFCQRCALTG